MDYGELQNKPIGDWTLREVKDYCFLCRADNFQKKCEEINCILQERNICHDYATEWDVSDLTIDDIQFAISIQEFLTPGSFAYIERDTNGYLFLSYKQPSGSLIRFPINPSKFFKIKLGDKMYIKDIINGGE